MDAPLANPGRCGDPGDRLGYSPNLRSQPPVCLQRWEWGGSTYFECAYTSWDQCRASAIGLSAMCVDNPYWQRPQARLSGGRLRSSTPY
ncbi:DUF3551 domain-containing protein [Bradyrhizobium sp. 956_D2_N1_5]|uniref:DUF3551 domain-containing protein n=1 Tax=unclassified Bradyrhizobium TaxID=2631580 RepID=UPI003F2351F4